MRSARNAIFAGAAAVVFAATALTAAQAAEASSAGYPAHLAAPYLQINTSDSGDMAADMSATHLKYYTLAFLVSNGGCSLTWEDGNEAVGAFTSAVSSLQSAGGNVIISFGGAGSTEVAQSCKSVPQLEAAYASVLNAYPGVTRLDFDIEAPSISDASATSRRNQALAKLQKADPGVSIDYTLPVNPSGLPSSPELSLVKQAKSDGVKVNLVNIMTQYFGSGQNDLADAESAANGTEAQLAKIYTGDSSKQLWDMLGLTPLAGAAGNGEDFTTSDATKLESFAAKHGVQELAFWEVDGNDKPLGYAYSKIFNKITS